MDDRSEYKLLTISLKRPPTYGSLQSYSQTQKQRFVVHQLTTDDTLQGLALKYNCSVCWRLLVFSFFQSAWRLSCFDFL